MRDLILFGPQGSGKGTQAEFLRKRLPAKILATGEIARNLAKQKTEAGRQAKALIDNGELLPDRLLLPAVQAYLETHKKYPHFVFDGLPRTVSQARWLDTTLADLGRPSPDAYFLNITQAEAVHRLKKRTMCPVCHRTFNPRQQAARFKRCPFDNAELIRRPDDDPVVIRRRLQIFRQKSRGLKQYFARRHRLLNIPGKGTIQAVWLRLYAAWQDRKQTEVTNDQSQNT